MKKSKSWELDARTREQIREHYDIERELADKLRFSSREERRHLYSSAYNELFKRVLHHPQLTRKSSASDSLANVAGQLQVISPFLLAGTTYMEIGAGDCLLSLEVAKRVRMVYAVEVSEEITKGLDPPPNFRFVLSDGCNIPVPRGTVNFVYSNQLMEHLHPDDAFEQLKNIYEALAPGGVYLCITPHRFGGPHDVSKYFDTEAKGFHLKEYTVSELRDLFTNVGFSKVKVAAGPLGHIHNLPALTSLASEQVLRPLPYRYRRAITRAIPFRWLLGVRFIGIK